MKKLVLVFTIISVGQLYGMEPIEPEQGHYIGLGKLPREVQSLIISFMHNYDNLDDIIAGIKEVSTGIGAVNKQLNAIINEEYTSQKAFTKLVHLLGDKFHKSTLAIARQFKTPAGETYANLAHDLFWACMHENSKATTRLINEGADINMTSNGSTGGGITLPLLNYVLSNTTDSWDVLFIKLFLKPLLEKHKDIVKVDPQILFIAYQEAGDTAPEVIDLLLQHGADPNTVNISTNIGLGKTLLQYLKEEEKKSSRWGLSPRDQQIKSLLEKAIAEQ